MSKKKAEPSNSKPDLFGLPAEGDQTDAGQEDEDEDEGGAYTIHQIIAAEGGWRAAFNDPTAPDKVRVIPLACFALVEMQAGDEVPQRAVRPMIADDVGQVEDVAAYEDFICVVPPGFQPHAVIERVQRQAVVAGDAEA